MMYQIDKEVFNIARVQLRVLEPVPALVPFQDSTMGPFNTFGLSIITLEDSEGNIGEAPIYSSYINILERCLFPILFHSPNIPYHDIYPMLYWSIRNEGFRGPASALLGQLDLALHDLASRRSKVPLYKYLNAGRNYVHVYGSGGGTNYSYQELEEEIGLFLREGVDCIKMKVGKDFGTKMEEDIERVKFVRQLAGKDVKLALDANQIWSVEQALYFIRQVEDQDIEWFEEPVHSASLSEIEELCAKSPVKVSYGESERSAKMFPALIKAGVKHLQPVPTHLSGIKEWMDVRDLAIRSGADFSSGGYTFYTASLMATTPERWRVEYLYAIMGGLQQYFSIYPAWVNGKLILPDADGLSVHIDWDYCNKKNKIIMTRSWTAGEIPKYKPEAVI